MAFQPDGRIAVTAARNAQRALARGVALLDAGRPAQALTHLRTTLELAPNNAGAASFMGCALTRLGRPAEAAPFILGAVRAAPDEPQWRLHLAEWHLAQDRAGDAEREVLGLLHHRPQDATAWTQLGDAQAAQNKIPAAREAYQRALSLSEGDPEVTIKLARISAAAGDIPGAWALIQSVRNDTSEAFWRLKADLLVVERNWPALRTHAQAWRKAQPENPAAVRMEAAAAFELGDFKLARNATRKMLALATPSSTDWAAYGQICLQINDFDEAERAFSQAAKLAPDDPALLAGRARLLTFQGRLDDAEAACRAALARDPNRADTYWLLALLTRGHFQSQELASLRRLTQQSGGTPDDRAMAGLALGHGLEATGDIEGACAAYDSAHAQKRDIARREGYGYDWTQSEARFARIQELFAAPPPGRAPVKGPKPIFIFGMPRSGTTLTDAVLAGHPLVQDCGERVVLEMRLNEILRRQDLSLPSPVELEQWARDYLAEISLRPGIAYVIDKNPLNFQAAGLIAQLFPNAIMIHLRRNPLEVGLSIWRHEFSKGWTFTTSLADIGHFYGQYAKLAAHWQRVLGARLVTIQYEDFATNFSRAAPELLARIGLEWHEACGDFSRPRPPIATLTAVQVRDKVRPAAPRAPRFGAYLEPLRAALLAADVDLATGAWRGGDTGVHEAQDQRRHTE
jgi:Flp pilus assembly protein TadD